jgi:hypothetical protein
MTAWNGAVWASECCSKCHGALQSSTGGPHTTSPSAAHLSTFRAFAGPRTLWHGSRQQQQQLSSKRRGKRRRVALSSQPLATGCSKQWTRRCSQAWARPTSSKVGTTWVPQCPLVFVELSTLPWPPCMQLSGHCAWALPDACIAATQAERMHSTGSGLTLLDSVAGGDAHALRRKLPHAEYCSCGMCPACRRYCWSLVCEPSLLVMQAPPVAVTRLLMSLLWRGCALCPNTLPSFSFHTFPYRPAGGSHAGQLWRPHPS